MYVSVLLLNVVVHFIFVWMLFH